MSTQRDAAWHKQHQSGCQDVGALRVHPVWGIHPQLPQQLRQMVQVHCKVTCHIIMC